MQRISGMGWKEMILLYACNTIITALSCILTMGVLDITAGGSIILITAAIFIFEAGVGWWPQDLIYHFTKKG